MIFQKKNIFYLSSSSKCSWRAVLNHYYEMRDFLGFQFMLILNLYGIPFHDVVFFRPEHDFLFKSDSTYCDGIKNFRNPCSVDVNGQVDANQSILTAVDFIIIWKHAEIDHQPKTLEK